MNGHSKGRIKPYTEIFTRSITLPTVILSQGMKPFVASAVGVCQKAQFRFSHLRFDQAEPRLHNCDKREYMQ